MALQGADSLGTSAALTEKELIKTDTIDMMDTLGADDNTLDEIKEEIIEIKKSLLN